MPDGWFYLMSTRKPLAARNNGRKLDAAKSVSSGANCLLFFKGFPWDHKPTDLLFGPTVIPLRRRRDEEEDGTTIW